MNNNLENQIALDAMIRGIQQFVTSYVDSITTKIYDGIVTGQNGDKWDVKYNGKVHTIPLYGNNSPSVGKVVKVYIPQGNPNLTYFI